MEVVSPADEAPQVKVALDAYSYVQIWCVGDSTEWVVWRAIIDAQEVELVLDRLESRFGGTSGFRVVLQTVEAVIPKPFDDDESVKNESSDGAEASQAKGQRISRPELYEDIASESELSVRFIVMVVLATVVVTVGLIQDSSVVVLAAMVIAPLLGPNMAMALGTTLGDTALIRRSAYAATTGFAVALGLAVAYGMVGPLPLDGGEITTRTGLGASDLVLSLAAGIAGTLAYTKGAPSSLIGVMVAVALLPPTVVAGLMLGRGAWEAGFGALLLVLSNVICVHLAGVATFMIQGIKPSRWWEAEKAKRATRRSLSISVVLMLGLVALVVFRVFVRDTP